MGSILAEARTVFALLMEVRSAKKDGAEIRVQRVKSLPPLKTGYWLGTMEGCLLRGELNQAVKAVFYRFPEETQHALTFSPSSGEWISRANFWKRELKPALPPHQYRAAMTEILDWYIHCLTRRESAARREGGERSGYQSPHSPLA